MNPFRIAILIFLVGGTLANVVHAKLQHDSIRPATASTSIEPETLEEKYGDHPTPTPMNLWDAPATAQDPETEKLETLATDRAYLYEIVIVTLAAIVWFLVPVKSNIGGKET